MNTQDAIDRINLGKCEIIREYNNTVDDYNDVYNYCRNHMKCIIQKMKI